jgi:hypothetical protein
VFCCKNIASHAIHLGNKQPAILLFVVQMSLLNYFKKVTAPVSSLPTTSVTNAEEPKEALTSEKDKAAIYLTPAPTDLGNDEPRRPHLKTYCPSNFGSRIRDFSSKWFVGRPWLEYSIEKQAAFCFCCRNFGCENQMQVIQCYSKVCIAFH